MKQHLSHFTGRRVAVVGQSRVGLCTNRAKGLLGCCSFTAVGALVGTGAIINAFTSTAVPQGIGSTGPRGFGSNQTGVVRYTTTDVAPTNASSALVGASAASRTR
jgi:hypothetical protein